MPVIFIYENILINCNKIATYVTTCSNAHYVTSREMRLVTCCVLAAITCSKSANEPSTSCVCMAC